MLKIDKKAYKIFFKEKQSGVDKKRYAYGPEKENSNGKASRKLFLFRKHKIDLLT